MKKTLCVLAACSIALSSCNWFNNNILKRGEYAPAYLQEDSPLDPPGAAAARAAARAKLLKEGAFATGDTPEVQQGKAFLFDRNPDHTEDPGGRMVETSKAKIIACEGLYYFVETDDGKRGFLRESDFVDPVRLAPTSELVGSDLPPDFAAGADVFPDPDAPLELDHNQKLMTNQNGRTVVVAQKKSDKSDEFEAQKRAIEAGHPLDEALPPPSHAEATGDAINEDEPLPEPAAATSGN